MTNSLVQFRTDENTRNQAAEVCEKLGIDLATYLRICIVRLIQEQGIPFSMKLTQNNNAGIEAMKAASRIAKANGISDITIDEINFEIEEARK